jgi:transposase
MFGTFTADLEQLREFLRQNKVHRLVMESTGVYWMPVRNVLERGDWKFDLILVNPQHVRALQGEKTDDKDCRRLAELGQHNLLRGSTEDHFLLVSVGSDHYATLRRSSRP